MFGGQPVGAVDVAAGSAAFDLLHGGEGGRFGQPAGPATTTIRERTAATTKVQRQPMIGSSSAERRGRNQGADRPAALHQGVHQAAALGLLVDLVQVDRVDDLLGHGEPGEGADDDQADGAGREAGQAGSHAPPSMRMMRALLRPSLSRMVPTSRETMKTPISGEGVDGSRFGGCPAELFGDDRQQGAEEGVVVDRGDPGDKADDRDLRDRLLGDGDIPRLDGAAVWGTL